MKYMKSSLLIILGFIPSALSKKQKNKKKTLTACIGPYPGTDTDADGKVEVKFYPNADGLTFKHKLKNLEEDVTGGTHIHSGTTCDNADDVGGHYWDAGSDGTTPDQWTPEYGAVYETNGKGSTKGSFSLDSGYGYDENIGHAVVVHDSTGARVGCGVLVEGKEKC
jgi:Cu/Zn superoxide dismutase